MVDIPTNTRIRPNATDMSTNQVANYVNTLLTMKQKFRPGGVVSIYDEFVIMHWGITQLFYSGSRIDGAHGRDAFLPWHREYLWHFENELKAINSSVSLPYWDWSGTDTSWEGVSDTDNWDKNQLYNNLFSDQFIGPAGNAANSNKITSGHFTAADWDIVQALNGLTNTWSSSWGDSLRRNSTLNVNSWDSWRATTYSVIQEGNYTDFRSQFEGTPHGTGHVWVGGHMQTMGSPMDPIFFLHHAQVDRIWYHWQRNKIASWGKIVGDSTPQDWYNTYLWEDPPGVFFEPNATNTGIPNFSARDSGHKLEDAMWPWDNGERPRPPVPTGNSALQQAIDSIENYYRSRSRRVKDTLNPYGYSYAYDSDEAVLSYLIPIAISGCCQRCNTSQSSN